MALWLKALRKEGLSSMMTTLNLAGRDTSLEPRREGYVGPVNLYKLLERPPTAYLPPRTNEFWPSADVG